MYACGIDNEEIARFRENLEAYSHGKYHRMFFEGEHEYCAQHVDPACRYAARWCAKEAAVKALSKWINLHVRHIEICHNTHGRPELVVHHKDYAALRLQTDLSMSHSQSMATAIVIVWPTV